MIEGRIQISPLKIVLLRLAQIFQTLKSERHYFRTTSRENRSWTQLKDRLGVRWAPHSGSRPGVCPGITSLWLQPFTDERPAGGALASWNFSSLSGLQAAAALGVVEERGRAARSGEPPGQRNRARPGGGRASGYFPLLLGCAHSCASRAPWGADVRGGAGAGQLSGSGAGPPGRALPTTLARRGSEPAACHPCSLPGVVSGDRWGRPRLLPWKSVGRAEPPSPLTLAPAHPLGWAWRGPAPSPQERVPSCPQPSR